MFIKTVIVISSLIQNTPLILNFYSIFYALSNMSVFIYPHFEYSEIEFPEV